MSERLRDLLGADGGEGPVVTRRQALAALGGGGLSLGAGKAVDNVFVGYGVLVGTNLLEEDLAAYAAERLQRRRRYAALTDRHRVRLDGSRLSVHRGKASPATLSLPGTTVEEAREVDDDLGLSRDPLSQLVADLGAVADGRVRFEFSQYPAFFERLRSGEPRPFTVGALRGPFDGVSPGQVAALTGADPARPEAVVEGLATGFREHTSYDVARYAAGSVEDNLLFGAVDLRRHFESPTSFEALLADRTSGMFCYEFAWRSLEALQAVPAHRQLVPVFGGVVTDGRHKHAYTAVASAVREGGDLVVPVTFVDYTHSTLYDDLALRGVLGEGLKAYDDRHRTDGIYWHRYAAV